MQTRRTLKSTIALLLIVLTVTLMPETGSVAATGGAHLAAAPTVSMATTAKTARKWWSPHARVTLNNPLGNHEQQSRLIRRIIRAIQNTRTGGTIRIMSWNVLSTPAVNALLYAQKRGVMVRVLMDRDNLTLIDNPPFRRLHRGLIAGNKGRRLARHSYAKTCVHSCRGRAGAAHAKYYLFTRVGDSKRVVMEGSANMTTASAINQWNDLLTFVGNERLYRWYLGIFNEMWRDKPQARPWRVYRDSGKTFYFSPEQGQGFTGDPFLRMLQSVKCKGAVGAGSNGTTVIRSAPDVLRNERGWRFATNLKALYNEGCDVRLVYTVMGTKIHQYLTANTGRGPMPMQHLVQDFNGDGEFDNYFHLKVLTVSGVVGANHSAKYVMQGSSNISGFAAASDEQFTQLASARYTDVYQNWITYWYDNAPPMSQSTSMRIASGRVNPYAHVDMD